MIRKLEITKALESGKLVFPIGRDYSRGTNESRDTGDDPLKLLLSKRELVVQGKIIDEPREMLLEAGVPNYFSRFRIQDVLKGDAKLKDQIIEVNIVRFENDPKDKHPLIKKANAFFF